MLRRSLLASLALPAIARAQTAWPNGPVRIVVPAPPMPWRGSPPPA